MISTKQPSTVKAERYEAAQTISRRWPSITFARRSHNPPASAIELFSMSTIAAGARRIGQAQGNLHPGDLATVEDPAEPARAVGGPEAPDAGLIGRRLFQTGRSSPITSTSWRVCQGSAWTTSASQAARQTASRSA